VQNKKRGVKMETKLKKKTLRNYTLPIVQDSKKSYTRNTGITTRNVKGISPEFVAYEQSKEYSTFIAEIEIKRARALAEAYRLSLR
jgi:hypothetical protein